MQFQTFNFQNYLIRNTITFNKLSVKLELNFTRQYHERSIKNGVSKGFAPQRRLLHEKILKNSIFYVKTVGAQSD